MRKTLKLWFANCLVRQKKKDNRVLLPHDTDALILDRHLEKMSEGEVDGGDDAWRVHLERVREKGYLS